MIICVRARSLHSGNAISFLRMCVLHAWFVQAFLLVVTLMLILTVFWATNVYQVFQLVIYEMYCHSFT